MSKGRDAQSKKILRKKRRKKKKLKKHVSTCSAMLRAVLWSKDSHLLVFSIPHNYIGLFFPVCFCPAKFNLLSCSPMSQHLGTWAKNQIFKPCTDTFCSSFKKNKTKQQCTNFGGSKIRHVKIKARLRSSIFGTTKFVHQMHRCHGGG